MASNKAQKQKESQLKIEIEVTNGQLKTIIETGTERQISATLVKFRSQLNDLQSLVYARLAATSSLDQREKDTAEWVTYYTPLENDYTAHTCRLEERFPEANPATAAKEAEFKAKETAVKNLKTNIEETIKGINENIDKEPKTTVLARNRYDFYMSNIAELKVQIEHEIKPLVTAMIQLKPEDSVSIMDYYDGTKINLQNKRNEAMFKLTGLNIEPVNPAAPPLDVTQQIVQDPISAESISAAVTAGIQALNETQGLFRSSTRTSFVKDPEIYASDYEEELEQDESGKKYKYKADDLPTFLSGDSTDFPEFYREWHSCVMPGKSKTWIQRALNKATPDCDDLRVFANPKECWAYLKQKYANPVACSNDIIHSFVTETHVPGKNDDQKLINLLSRLLKMSNGLKTVGQEEQLTNNVYVLDRAMKLIPEKFNDRFSEKRKAVDKSAPGASSSPKDMWNVLKTFLEEERDTIMSYRPSNLTGNPGWTKTSKSQAVKQSPPQKPPVKTNAFNTGPNGLSKKEKVKKKQLEFGKCPVCSKYHLWKGKFGEAASSKLADCPQWRDLAVEAKVDKVISTGSCLKCTSWRHKKDACPSVEFKCNESTATGVCGKHHHRSMHNSTNPLVVNLYRISACSHMPLPDGAVMLPIIETNINGKFNTILFFDTGSTISLITHELASRLKLKGRFTRELVELAGKEPEIMDTSFYVLTWNLPDGRTIVMRLLGMEHITTNVHVAVDHAYQLFPHLPHGSIDRPKGEIGILLGQDNARLLPVGGEGRDTVEDLRVQTVCFGTGYVLSGHHPAIKASPVQYSQQALLWRSARFLERPSLSLNTCSVRPIPLCAAVNMDFMEAESIGPNVPRKCKSCSGCSSCHITDNSRTLKEQLELDLLRKSVHLNEAENRIEVSYPIIGDTSGFVDNFQQVVTKAASNWKSLEKKGMLDAYSAQINDYIERGVLREVSREEVKAYAAEGGVVHYVSHHGVLNDHSSSTPLRVVVNTAMPNNWSGPVPNDMWPKGPNSLNNMFEVLIRFRSYVVAMVFDIAKAYHALKTGVPEFFMRLLVWRKSDKDEWTTYGHDTVAFGDRPAAIDLELGKAATADAGKEIDQEAAEKLTKDSYVDDGASGGSRESVSRMVGNVTKLANGKFGYDGTMSRILAKGGFKPKVFIVSGEDDPDILAKVGKVLGVKWNPTNDTLEYQLTVNLSQRRGASRSHPDLVEADIPDLDALVFTKRVSLQVAAQLYDPYGHLTPFTIKFKIGLKRVVELEVNWDTPLPEKHQKEWLLAVKELILSDMVSFPRSLRVDGVVDRCEVVGYFDGSDLAFAGVVYTRWKFVGQPSWHVSLVTSKARITPKGGITTPRSELQGLVVLVRIMDKVVRSLEFPPARCTIIGDSQATIAACDFNASALQPYFANRVLEVVETMKSWGSFEHIPFEQELPEEHLLDPDAVTVVDPLLHTPGLENIADWPTRGTVSLSQLGPGSLWQTGPEYLSSDREDWPVSRQFVKQVPEEETRKKFLLGLNAMKVDSMKPANTRFMLLMGAYDDIFFIRSVIARLWRATRLQDEQEINNYPTVKDYKMADLFMAWIAMFDTTRLLQRHDLSSLAPFRAEGCWWTQGRVPANAMNNLIGHKRLLILDPDSRLAYLILLAAHRQDHRRGAGDCLFRSREMGVWIHRGRRVAEKIVKNCQKCKVIAQETAQQQMAQLPPERFEVPTRPFTMICLDFLAPVMVKEFIRRKASRKIFPLVITCFHTEALHPIVSEGYSTETFLEAFKAFTSIRGVPIKVFTDLGSQLTCAGKLMTHDGPDEKTWSTIQGKTAAQGITWSHAPAASAWRNGRAEAAVKMLKRSIKVLTSQGDLTAKEYENMLLRCANAINSRPLGLRHHGGANPEYHVITPNLLLVGSRNDTGLSDIIENVDNSIHTRRYAFVEKVYWDWWQVWKTQVFESLVPFRRWKKEVRNVRVGDICLIKTPKKLTPGHYKLARIVEVMPDIKGLVRTVIVETRPADSRERSLPYVSKRLVRMKLPVQRLVIIHAVEELEQVPEYDAVSQSPLVTQDPEIAEQLNHASLPCCLLVTCTWTGGSRGGCGHSGCAKSLSDIYF